MDNPCIICVAITGSVPTKKDNPAVPISIPEQIESTQECFEIGASIVHCHVRNDDGTPSIDPDKYRLLKEGIEKYCPGMIIQLSTGGRSGHGFDRGKMLPLKPDMASLTVGSNNFPTRVYENPPDLVDWLAKEMIENSIKPEIEIFDLFLAPILDLFLTPGPISGWRKNKVFPVKQPHQGPKIVLGLHW